MSLNPDLCSMEELRKLPHNWGEIVTARNEKLVEPSREIFQIPVMDLNEETQGPSLRQQCTGFKRKSAAICLLPGPGGQHERSRSKSSPDTVGGYENNASKLISNASNWKTKICNNWKSSGCCFYGTKCNFAHGYAELQHHAGRPVNREAVDSSTIGVPAKASVGTVGAPASLVPYTYHVGDSSQRSPSERPPIKRWKGPNKINKSYGDWIDDL